MSRLEIVIYPTDLDALAGVLARLGFQELARSESDDGSVRGVRLAVPAESATIELAEHDVARALTGTLGTDVVAGLCLYVDSADDAWDAALHAGLRLDPVCAEGPSTEPWGRFVRGYCPGGLRLDMIEEPAD